MREVNADVKALKKALKALPEQSRKRVLSSAETFSGEQALEFDLWLANNLDALWSATTDEAQKVGGAVAGAVEAAAASVGRTAAAVVAPVASSLGVIGYVAGAALLLWAWRSKR